MLQIYAAHPNTVMEFPDGRALAVTQAPMTVPASLEAAVRRALPRVNHVYPLRPARPIAKPFAGKPAKKE
jgi:hypothetical protein